MKKVYVKKENGKIIDICAKKKADDWVEIDENSQEAQDFLYPPKTAEKEIFELKQKLIATDYILGKHQGQVFAGILPDNTDDEVIAIEKERQDWRVKIRELEKTIS